MPLYEYICPNGHRHTESRPWEKIRSPSTCSCGEAAVYTPSLFRVGTPFRDQLSLKGTTMEDVWQDNPLGDLDDGINPLTYRSEKPFIDMGKEP